MSNWLGVPAVHEVMGFLWGDGFLVFGSTFHWDLLCVCLCCSVYICAFSYANCSQSMRCLATVSPADSSTTLLSVRFGMLVCQCFILSPCWVCVYWLCVCVCVWSLGGAGEAAPAGEPHPRGLRKRQNRQERQLVEIRKSLTVTW